MTNKERKRWHRRRLLALSVPIMIQNVLSSTVNSMDVLMLNFVGQDAISAVSLASQIAWVLFMVYYGLGTGVTMLASQYYGKGEMEPIRIVQGIALRISLSVSVIAAAAALLIPHILMRIFTNDAVLISLGSQYLRYVSAAYLCWGISEIYLAALRSIGKVKTATTLSVMAFVLNIVFNAVFIFGFLGAPRMGAAGVALGTTLSRLIQLAACAVVSARSQCKLCLSYMFHRSPALFRDFCHMALPAMFNDIVWGVAFSMYSVILGHLDSDAVAANSLVGVVRNFGTTMCFGVANGGGILLGQIIGENRMEDAREAARELVRQTLVFGALGALLIAGIAPIALRVAALTPTAMGYLRWMLAINVFYIFGPAVNTTLICGVFRSGGDSTFGFKVDSIDMWCYAVPLGLINAFVLKLPVMWVYFFMCTDEFVKWPWVLRYYRSGRWLRNITREDW